MMSYRFISLLLAVFIVEVVILIWVILEQVEGQLLFVPNPRLFVLTSFLEILSVAFLKE